MHHSHKLRHHTSLLSVSIIAVEETAVLQTMYTLPQTVCTLNLLHFSMYVRFRFLHTANTGLRSVVYEFELLKNLRSMKPHC